MESIATSEDKNIAARRVTITGAVINSVLAVMKFTGGLIFHSSALLADAVDSTTDLLTDGITLIAFPISRKPVDPDHPYGHGRVETLAALIVSGFLIAAALLIASKSIRTLTSGEITIPTWPALIVASLSIVVKEFMFRWTNRVAVKLNSRVLAANAWNHRGDALSSIAVFIGIGGTIVIPGAYSLDAWASLVVVLFILRAGLRIAKSSADDLLDKAQDHELLDKAQRIAWSVTGVHHAHRARSRRYGPMTYIDLDIEVAPEMSVAEAHDISHQVQERILAECPNVADVLIHIEPEDDHLKGEGTVRTHP